MIAETLKVRWLACGLVVMFLLGLPAVVVAKKAASTSTNAAPVTEKAPKTIAGDDLFEPAPLRKIQIQIVGAALDQLRKDDRRYARATFRDGTTVIQDVGVHVKGSAGSRRNIDDLPALTVHFDKFVPGQRWHGLARVHLNNSVQDGSKLTENICAELFRQAGVPAPRVTNIRMQLNNRDLGVYVMIEGLDKTFIKQHFQNTKGNIYDGGFCHDIEQPLEKISGSAEKEQPEIKALVAAAHEPNLAKRWTRLEQLLDMDRFITYCALEVMMYDWDGYVLKPNNYKLYWDPVANKITFFPHGMDQMFWEPKFPILPGMNGLVARAVVETPEGKRRYVGRMTELTTNVFKVDAITNRINAYASQIHASLAERNANEARDYDGQAQRIRDLVAARSSFLKQQLLFAPAKPVTFQNGVAQVKEWQSEYESSVARRESGQGQNGKDAWSLTAGVRNAASWRAKVILPAGRYRFEATARTAAVVSAKDEVGEGAGIRVSGSRQMRSNKVVGDSTWQKLSYDFEVPVPPEEVTLVCELRATKGQVWFDAESLRLTKLPLPRP